MELILRVKTFIVNKIGDSWTVKINNKTYEASGISIDIHDTMGDVNIMGLDNPLNFELYESCRKAEIESEPDGSLYIILYVEHY
jgi:hypothetical protein